MTRTGKNLYEPTGTEYKNESGVAFNGFNITSLVTFLNTLPIGAYNVSFKFNVLETVSGATSWGILLRNSVSGYIDGRQNGQHNSGETLSFTRSITITAENKGQFANAYLYSGGGNRAKVYWYDFQLEVGSTATAYEPYQGDTYSITFPSSAGTVYGGTLDVTSGKLTVAYGIVDMGSLQWNRDSGGTFYVAWSQKKPASLQMICEELATWPYSYSFSDYANYPDNIIAGNTGSGNKYFYVKATSYATAADFRTAMSGVQLVYELATPIVYDLTPTEVSTLLGTNNIFADCGDTTVDYYADPTLYINRKIAAAVAAMS